MTDQSEPHVIVSDPAPEMMPRSRAEMERMMPTPETAIFAIIERAVRDPSVDVDKMERLMAMQERLQEKAAETYFDNAMADAQQEMEPVRAEAKNPQASSKYASYHALDTAIRPIYAKYGFSLSFDTADAPNPADIRIVCKVAHRSGHRERPHIDMPADGKGARGGDVMTRTHATGSAITYGKRYLLAMIFNVAVSQDDDGNAAGARSAPARSGYGLGMPSMKKEAAEISEAQGHAPGKKAGKKTEEEIKAERMAKVAENIKLFVDGAIDLHCVGGAPVKELVDEWMSMDDHATKIDYIRTGFPDEYKRLIERLRPGEKHEQD